MYHFVEHTRACEICGKSFKVGGGRSRWNKKTCGPACAHEKIRRNQAAWRRAHPGRRSIRVLGAARVCAVCGRPFTLKSPHGWSRTVCSKACRDERIRRGNKAWYEAHPDVYRQRYRRGGAIPKDEERSRFRDELKQGFCLGCGGKTRHVKPEKRRSTKDKDSVRWHRTCHRRFLYRWTRGLYTALGEERACSICRRKFMARTFGGFIQKVCSEECRLEQRSRWRRAWRARHQKQVALWKEAHRDRLHAQRQARRRR